MNRYLFNKISNNRFLTSTYPAFPQKSTDKYIISRSGDRLDLLANQFYGDVTLYWVIAIANPDKINMGSLFLTEGSQIRIPSNVVEVVDSFNLLNQ